MTKTNAMRMLDRVKIKYDVLQYDYDESDLSGVHAAAALSLDPNHVFKSLVTRGGKNGLFVFCIPVGAELYARRLLADRHEKAVSDFYRLHRI